jgi:hypothetical protein
MVLPVLAGRNESLEREIGHVTLETARAGHDGGAPPRRTGVARRTSRG